jgi:hypothetical protein
MWVMWNPVLVCLEIMLVLVQDRSMICTKCTIGSEIVLYAPVGTPKRKAQVEGHFGPFGDCANLDT